MNAKIQSVAVSVVLAVALGSPAEAWSQAKKPGLSPGATVKIAGKTARLVILDGVGNWTRDGSGFEVSHYPALTSIETLSLEDLTLKQVPLPSGVSAYAVPSPDGTRFAYTVETGKMNNTSEDLAGAAETYAQELWVGGSGMASPSRLTSGFVDESPRWSPDGKTLVFNRKITVAVASSVPASSSPSSGWRGRSGWQKGSPGWLKLPGLRMEAQIIPASGGKPRPLCPWKDHVENPEWSPSGKSVAFLSDHDTEPDDGMHLWVVDPADTECNSARRLTQRRAGGKAEGGYAEGDAVFAWSPDGSKLAVIVHHPKDEGLLVVDADGSNLKRLLEHAELDFRLSWSFDSQLVALSTKVAVPGPRKTENSLSVLDLKGKEVWRFSAKPGKKDQMCFALPTGGFSPRARLLSIDANCEPSIPHGLYVVDLR